MAAGPAPQIQGVVVVADPVRQRRPLMRGGRGWQSGQRPCCATAMGTYMAGGVAATGTWVAPMAADLASCPDPSRYGLGRPWREEDR